MTNAKLLAEIVNNISTLELARAVTRVEGATIQDVLTALTEIENEQS